VLTVVLGSSGLDDVVGALSHHPAELLEVDGATRAGHVLVLAPWYLAAVAREQAHVLVAAAPSTNVAVLTPRHHPLTLTLIGAAAQRTAGPDADPGLVVALAAGAAARSRSLVWYPRVWGLREPAPTAGQLLASTFGAPGYFREIGTETGLLPARRGVPARPTAEVCVAGSAPALLLRHLGNAVVRTATLTLDPHERYATRSSVPLTLLAAAPAPAWEEPPCAGCQARLAGGRCAFCGFSRASARIGQLLETVEHG
jgi:hypothetical protein